MWGEGGILYQRRDALALAVGVRVRVLVVAPVALRLVSSGASAKASATVKVRDGLRKLGQELGLGLVFALGKRVPSYLIAVVLVFICTERAAR